MAAITVISPAMEAHIAGCGDIEKAVKRGRGEQIAETYNGLTLLDAIVETDTDWADSFGEEAYQADRTHWGIFNMDVKPCLLREIAKARIVFGENGQPEYATTEAEIAAVAPASGTCQCGCGGSPKGAKSRFLPGHDARVKKGGK